MLITWDDVWMGVLQGLKARRRIMQEIAQCIKQRQGADESARNHEDALSLILEAMEEDGSKGMSLVEIQDSALEMLFAGHLPTSSAACSVLGLMASNPPVRRALYM